MFCAGLKLDGLHSLIPLNSIDIDNGTVVYKE